MESSEEAQALKAVSGAMIAKACCRACWIAGGRAAVAASAAAAADGREAYLAPKSWRSGAKQQQRDVVHRATAAAAVAAGTAVGSTSVVASKECHTTVDHVRPSAASGWKQASSTAESGSLRLVDMADG